MDFELLVKIYRCKLILDDFGKIIQYFEIGLKDHLEALKSIKVADPAYKILLKDQIFSMIIPKQL